MNCATVVTRSSIGSFKSYVLSCTAGGRTTAAISGTGGPLGEAVSVSRCTSADCTGLQHDPGRRMVRDYRRGQGNIDERLATDEKNIRTTRGCLEPVRYCGH
jgi:hypothetical protein